MSASALQKAAYDALIGDTQLVALLGSPAIFDVPPSNRTLPLVLIGNVMSEDWSTDTDLGQALTITFQCWSNLNGRKQIHAIAERISEILGAGLTSPSSTDWNFILTQPLTSRIERDVSARATRATLRFRVLAERKN